jgi:RNA polymerase sigma factor (TIGR02999 family)
MIEVSSTEGARAVATRVSQPGLVKSARDERCAPAGVELITDPVAGAEDSVNSLLARADAGDVPARDALFEALYHELHRLAEAQLRRSGGPITLGTTTLLHEAYLSVSNRENLSFVDRNRFFGYAARAMRGLVLNYVRDRRVQKRGGELTFTSLDEANAAAYERPEELEQLDRALEELSALEPELAELVDLRFFGGLSFAEMASIRGVSERTVQRDWAKARTLLYSFLGGQEFTG